MCPAPGQVEPPAPAFSPPTAPPLAPAPPVPVLPPAPPLALPPPVPRPPPVPPLTLPLTAPAPPSAPNAPLLALPPSFDRPPEGGAPALPLDPESEIWLPPARADEPAASSAIAPPSSNIGPLMPLEHAAERSIRLVSEMNGRRDMVFTQGAFFACRASSIKTSSWIRSPGMQGLTIEKSLVVSWGAHP